MRPRRKVGISEAKEGSEHKSGKGGKWTLVRQRREVGISEAKGEVGIGEAKEKVGKNEAMGWIGGEAS